MGRGDSQKADHEAQEAMAAALNQLPMKGRIICGEEGRTGGQSPLNSQNLVGTGEGPELNVEVKMGSYAWAVSGDKTASGNPIVYSGPQMGFTVPSIVTEGSIRGGGLEISGMTVPYFIFLPTLMIVDTTSRCCAR